MANVRYIESRDIWRMDKMHDGIRKTFYSKEKSKIKAQMDCERQFYLWLDDYLDNKQIKFIDAWNEYVEDYSKRYKASSTYRLEETAHTYLLPRFKTKKLKDISRLDYQKVIDEEYKSKHLAKRTLKRIASCIRTFLTFCATKGYIDYDDVPRKFIIPADAPIGTKRALTPAEIKDMMTTDDPNWYLPMFKFLIFTGIRRGELCALQTKRDLIEPYIYIRESISARDLKAYTPKSGKPRQEYLNDYAIMAIIEHWRRRDEKSKNFEYVFCSRIGRRINPKVLSKKWREYRKKHGLGEITLHELRHTYATYASKNVDLSTLKELLGHSDSMDTKGTYVHDVPLTKEEYEVKKQIDSKHAEKVENVFEIILKD